MAGGAPILLAAIASVALFTMGLRFLAHPRTAARGQLLVAVGVALNVAATIGTGGYDVLLFFLAVAIGGGAGALVAERTPLPSAGVLLAGILGFGGLAAALVGAGALRELVNIPFDDVRFETLGLGTILLARAGVSLAVAAGSATFGASLAAVGKIQRTSRPQASASRAGLFAVGGAALLTGVWFVFRPVPGAVDVVLGALSFLFGMLLLQSMRANANLLLALLAAGAGAAVLAGGFALHHNGLLVAGALSCSSALVFASLLSRTAGRTLADVALGGLRAEEGGAAGDDEDGAGRVKTTSPEDVAMMLEGARRVVLVPGFGLAAAQAHHTLRDLANLLRGRGAAVDYAIHPVAGCVPGQLNLLLTEADVPYDEMKELDAIGPVLAETDVALVVGASDIVNPRALTEERTALRGMPIVDVGRARAVVVVKRTAGPGESGVPNPLFTAENAMLLLGDGKKMLQELVKAVKENSK